MKRLALVVFVAGCTGTVDPKPGPTTGNTENIAACFDGTTRTPAAGEPRIRRLSRYELEHTVESLAPGFGKRVRSLLPADVVRDGFDSDAELLRASELYVDSLRRLADEISVQIPAAQLLPCGGAACADDFIADFGAKAFRRALRPIELQRYRAVFDVVAADDGPDGAARAVVEALLQSPSFLYRTELGDEAGALTRDELASALSYALWAAPPDAELHAAELERPEVRQSQLKRLLADARSREALDHFVEQWLELERLTTAVRDPVLFPIDSPALRAALRAETLDSFATAVNSGAGFPTLLTAVPAAVSNALTPIYGASWGNDRIGVLGQGAILMSHSTSDSASPVHRGKLVRSRFFCQSMPPPPPGVIAALPPFVPGQSNRDRFAEHSKSEACSGCHRLMDPIGLGFEGFDAMGRSIDVDSHGEVIAGGKADGAFNGMPELARRLATDDAVQACFLSMWSRHVLGVTGVEASCGEQGVLPTLSATPGSLEALMEVPLTSTYFAQRGSGSPAYVDPPVPDAGVAMPPSGIDVRVRVDSSWGTGSCRTVFVVNHTLTTQTWSVEQPKMGMLTNHWSSEVDETGATWKFSGASYNATLAPGAETSFGYCVQS